jgi:hypothetical protein
MIGLDRVLSPSTATAARAPRPLIVPFPGSVASGGFGRHTYYRRVTRRLDLVGPITPPSLHPSPAAFGMAAPSANASSTLPEMSVASATYKLRTTNSANDYSVQHR